MTSIWDTVVRVHWVAAVTLVPVASTALVEVLSVEEATSEEERTDVVTEVTVLVKVSLEGTPEDWDEEGTAAVMVALITLVEISTAEAASEDTEAMVVRLDAEGAALRVT